MSTLAWYYSRKLNSTDAIKKILTTDIKDINHYFNHLGFDFVDGSRLVFNVLMNENSIVEVELTEEQQELVNGITRSSES